MEVRAVDSEVSVLSDLPVPVPGRSPQNVVLQLLQRRKGILRFKFIPKHLQPNVSAPSESLNSRT